ncbi:MAG: hypothetical protein Q9180_004388 [Flavoplaca navasiana]
MTSTNPMEALSKSKAECLQTYLKEDGIPYSKLVIGAIILYPSSSSNSKILLLKRASHEDFYPNKFEIPGGKVEDSDSTVLDAVKREVFEEAAMEVTAVIGFTKSFDYETEKTTVVEGKERTVSQTSLQLNYVCEVAGYNFKVNPEEHSEGRFVSLADVEGLEMTEQMRAVVEAGLTWSG